MGTGGSVGENRAVEAAQKALHSPLLEEVNIQGAKGVLVNISAGSDLKLFEVNDAVTVITEAGGEDAHVIWGTVLDDTLGDELRVTVIATGFEIETNGRSRSEIGFSREIPRRLGAEIPAYIRRGAGQPEPATVAQASNGSTEEDTLEENAEEPASEDPLEELSLDDLEYPTFLRRRMVRK